MTCKPKVDAADTGNAANVDVTEMQSREHTAVLVSRSGKKLGAVVARKGNLRLLLYNDLDALLRKAGNGDIASFDALTEACLQLQRAWRKLARQKGKNKF